MVSIPDPCGSSGSAGSVVSAGSVGVGVGALTH